MAPHSSTLAWKIPWTEEPGRLQSMGSLESDTTERLHFHFLLSPGHLFEGNPVDKGTKRRVTDTPMHHSVKAAGSTHSSTRKLNHEAE